MSAYQVRNINRKAMVNGRKVVTYEVWRKIDGGWLFDGAFTAPHSVTNKKLHACDGKGYWSL